MFTKNAASRISVPAVFLKLTSFFIVVAFLSTILTTQLTLHASINAFHFAWADYFFSMITLLGDGAAAVFIIIFIFFADRRMALKMLQCLITISVTVWIFKFFIFPHAHRPAAMFQEMGMHLNLVKNVPVHFNRSFPSGHAATVFMMGVCLAWMNPNKTLQILYGGLCVLIAFSRVYLSQHFLEDVLVGSILGIFLTLIILMEIPQISVGYLFKFLKSRSQNKTAHANKYSI